jgi:hypothetical protein
MIQADGRVMLALDAGVDLPVKVTRPASFATQDYDCLAAEGTHPAAIKPRVLYTYVNEASQSSLFSKLRRLFRLPPVKPSLQVWIADADGSHVQRLGWLPIDGGHRPPHVHLNAAGSAIAFVLHGKLYVVPLSP